MKFQHKFTEESGFQLAPMLDIVFLLLIFFAVTHKMILDEHDLKVKVPTAPKSEQETARAISEITINMREEDGELVIIIDRERFTIEQLSTNLKRMVMIDPDQPVRLRCDKDLRFQMIADVISACEQAGIYNVGFPTRDKESQ